MEEVPKSNLQTTDNLVDELKSEIDINIIRKKLVQMLMQYPHGLELEQLSNAYLKQFGSHLIASDYGFDDIVDLLMHLNNTIYMEKGKNDDIRIHLKHREEVKIYTESDEKNSKFDNYKQRSLFCKVQSILEAVNGSIRLEDFLEEFKNKYGHDLNVKEYGCSSFHELIYNLSDEYEIIARDDVQILHYKQFEIPIVQDPLLLKCDSDNEDNESKFSRVLNSNTQNFLSKLLTEEFPNGLKIQEIVGAYQGLFAGDSDDLNPIKYGYLSLEKLLSEHTNICKLWRHDNDIFVYSPCNDMNGHSTVENKLFLLPQNAVKVGAKYSYVDITSLMPIGKQVDVVIAEVYSPNNFWLIHRSPECSQELDLLMDCMYYFYGSPIGNRYKVSSVDVGMPIAVLYADDGNYYRAYVTSLCNLYTIRVFFVDYGTNGKAEIPSIRLLHRKFMKLPAQGIRANLYNIKPPIGRETWPKSASRVFLDLIQNCPLVAEVIDCKGRIVVIDLWNTNNKEDLNIKEAFLNKILSSNNSFNFSNNKILPSSNSNHTLESLHTLQHNFSWLNMINKTEKINESKNLDTKSLNSIATHSNNSDNMFDTEKDKLESNRIIKRKKRQKLDLTVSDNNNHFLKKDFSNCFDKSNFTNEVINENALIVKDNDKVQVYQSSEKVNENITVSKKVLVEQYFNQEMYLSDKVTAKLITSDIIIFVIRVNEQLYIPSENIKNVYMIADDLELSLQRAGVFLSSVTLHKEIHFDIFDVLKNYYKDETIIVYNVEELPKIIVKFRFRNEIVNAFTVSSYFKFIFYL